MQNFEARLLVNNTRQRYFSGEVERLSPGSVFKSMVPPTTGELITVMKQLPFSVSLSGESPVEAAKINAPLIRA